jgi:hypothetical protein
MSFKSIEDSISQLTMDVFGRDTIYTPAGGSPVTIPGVFSNGWVDIQGMMELKAVLRIHLGDLIAKGDRASIDSVTYLVQESRPDGFGGCSLILQKA